MGSRFRRPSHATVVAYLALFIALSGTAVATDGGNFILGRSNSAASPTKLASPTTDPAGALKVTSTATSGGRAIQGTSNVGQGVYGHSNANAGVVGDSANFDGVFGVSHGSGAGVSGHNNTGGGFGLYGSATGGWAIGAAGNATQTRTGNGFVKAMAYVAPLASDPIQYCFNSQLPASQATSGHCGIDFSSTGPGTYDLYFSNFQVTDRFVSATPACACGMGAFTTGSKDVIVGARRPSDGALVDTAFYVFVY